MPVYVYRAATKRGLIVKNKVEETSKNNLYMKLKRSGLTPIEINQTAFAPKKAKTKKKNVNNVQEIMKNVNTTDLVKPSVKRMTTAEKINSYLGTTEKISIRDIVIFTQDFYLLKKANFNNIHALSTIIESTENMTFRGIIEDILAGVESGDYMYTTMEYYSDIFPYIYINMIKVGELSGSLTHSLKQAADYLDETVALTKKIKSILVPNLIQFVGLLILLLVGVLVAIPKIQDVFEELGTTDTLPAITLWFEGVVNTTMEYWYIPTIIIAGIVAGIIAYVHTPKGKYNFHYFKYTMPVFGKLIYSIDFSRLMKAMYLNLENGMRIQDALEVSKNVINNYVLLSIIETAINNILTGDSWIDPFERAGLGSPMTIEMLRIGMQTNLSEMLEKLTEYMEIDINQKLEKIMKILPQIVYVIVGIVLIFFVVVVLVPCIQVYMGNFLFSAYL